MSICRFPASTRALVAGIAMTSCTQENAPAIVTAATTIPAVTEEGGSALPPDETSEAAPSSLGDSHDPGHSKSELDWLLYMREEEKLARDVYLTRANDARVFSNIASSEQTHMDSVFGLLESYGLADPVGSSAQGVFHDVRLQSLYDELATRAGMSLVEALRVGAEIEEIDLADLDTALADTTHEDIARVYEFLSLGSRNHLRAFVRNLSMRGEVYVPLHLAQSDFDAIIASDMERGMGAP
jgi:hypothetical protein